MLREHDHSQLWQTTTQFEAEFESGPVGQVQVEEKHVWCSRGDDRSGLADSCSSSNEFKRWMALNALDDHLSKQRDVFDHGDTNCWGRYLRGSHFVRLGLGPGLVGAGTRENPRT